MKKKIMVGLMILLSTIIIACGKSETSEQNLIDAYSAYETGNYEDAGKIFKTCIANGDASEAVYLGYAKTLYQQKDYQEAAELGEKAIALKESQSTLYFMANLYEKMDLQDEAYSAYRKIVNQDAKSYQAWTKMDKILSEKGDYEALLKQYEEQYASSEEIFYKMKCISMNVILGKTDEARALIDTIEDEKLKTIYLSGIAAYEALQQGDEEKAKELLFNVENYVGVDSIDELYFGKYDEQGKRTGKGILFCQGSPNTRIYVGDFADDVKEGTGTGWSFYASDEDEKYRSEEYVTGTWSADLPEGECYYYEAYSNEYVDNPSDNYSHMTSCKANFSGGYANGAITVEDSYKGNDYGNDRQLLMTVEKGKNIQSKYNGKKAYYVELDSKGNVDYYSENYDYWKEFKWDVY